MKITKDDYLELFVKPVSEGGYGLPDIVLGWLEDYHWTGLDHVDIYTLIQADPSINPEIKNLKSDDIRIILVWMDKKNFGGKNLIMKENYKIKYNPH